MIYSVRGRRNLKWTRDSIMCCQRNMICDGCMNYDFCMRSKKENRLPKPPMKYTVLELYEKFGKPPERIEKEDESDDFDF